MLKYLVIGEKHAFWVGHFGEYRFYVNVPSAFGTMYRKYTEITSVSKELKMKVWKVNLNMCNGKKCTIYRRIATS